MRIILKAGDVRHGLRGLKVVWREEWHFKYQCAGALAGFMIVWLIDASPFELLLYAAFASLALASEIANTAIEDICNKIEPNLDPQIGMIKDMAQAFVLAMSLPVVLVFLWIVIDHLA